MGSPFAELVNPLDPRAARSNQNGGRLGTVTSNNLELNRYSGEVVEVNDLLVTIPVTGIALSNAANTIDSTGASTELAPAISTLHYCYLSNALASEFPEELRLSTVAPTDSNTSGQKYLGTTGNALNWRLVGLVYIDAAGNFADSVSQRHVINVDNKLPLRLSLTPGYNNNNAQTTIARTTATFAALNSGTGDAVSYVDDGAFPIWVSATFCVSSTPASVTLWGLGVDSTANAAVAACLPASAANSSVAVSLHIPPVSAQLRSVSMLCMTGAGATWIADHGRSGSAADVPATFLEGIIWG